MGGIVTSIVTAILCCLHSRIKGRGTNASGQSELEQLSRLTGGLAHEIKNPLSIIKVNLKLISESLNNGDRNIERAAKKITVVDKETERLSQILDNFLRYIKKTELHLSSVDINRLVTDMIDFYSPQAASYSVTIRSSICEQSLICKADRDMLKQVLLNLFINSQQAMSDGGELMLRTQQHGENAVVIVSDTGRGIEPKNMEKIFDAYFSTKSGGSGLGLPTSRKIIEAHSGSIKVDSIPGQGTSFTIQLPLENK